MDRSSRLGDLNGRRVRLSAAGVAFLTGIGTWLALGPAAVAVRLGSSLPRAAAVVSAGTWDRATPVPGIDKLAVGGQAYLTSVSCASAGNCAAGGYYYDRSGHHQVFVVNEVSGRWGSAEEVPGTEARNAGGNAGLASVSCGSAGNCAAGGSYNDSHYRRQAFVVDEVAGTWGRAKEVPGTPRLNLGGSARVNSVSCPSAGNCAAVGTYKSDSTHRQAFVVNEIDGTWGRAEKVAANLNAGGHAYLNSVSCATAGNCAAGGDYNDASNHRQAFVIDEVNGAWGRTEEVPGTPKLNGGGQAGVNSVSCPSAGNCAAVGSYAGLWGFRQVFVVDEVKGTWGGAEEVPGTATLNAGGGAFVYSVSCASAGNCAAGGNYTGRSGFHQVFIVDEVKGTWGNAEEVPGTATLNAGGYAHLNSVSCGSAGNCAAGGDYTADYIEGWEGRHPARRQVFVVNEVNGTWGNAKEVPATATLNAGGFAQLNSVSCVRAGNCAAGGYYLDDFGNSGHDQPFVVDYTPAPTVRTASPLLAPTSGPAEGGRAWRSSSWRRPGRSSGP